MNTVITIITVESRTQNRLELFNNEVQFVGDDVRRSSVICLASELTMDKYVKRIKRKEDDGHCSIETDVEKFYVPGNGLWMAADTSAVCALNIRQPAAPQKTERPVLPTSPILAESTALMDSSISTYSIIIMNNYLLGIIIHRHFLLHLYYITYVVELSLVAIVLIQI